MADEIGPDTPLRLADAVAIAFPRGGMTVSGLRRERDRGTLAVERIAGREFTTLRAIEEMRRRCLAPQKAPASTSSSQRAGPATGTSETVERNRARVALRQTLQELKKPSQNTSARSDAPAGRVIRLA